MLRLLRELKRRGILGMNSRNCSFVQSYNPRSLFPRADNKLLTKELARNAGIAVPNLLHLIRFTGEVVTLGEMIAAHPTFVIKPARGAGGEGILVINGREGDLFLCGSSTRLDLQELKHHSANILHGLYSLSGRPDVVMIEERIEFDRIFEDLTVGGVPDVRIIVFRGIPVMAMLRLPTKQSKGKANLHQGAIGVGISMATGTTTTGVHKSTVIEKHPDTGHPIRGLQLPRWQELLRIAAKCHEFSQLGYLGVDLVFDRQRGPLLLEINARPGLAVQIANQDGLRWRLERVLHTDVDALTIDQRLAMSTEFI